MDSKINSVIKNLLVSNLPIEDALIPIVLINDFKDKKKGDNMYSDFILNLASYNSNELKEGYFQEIHYIKYLENKLSSELILKVYDGLKTNKDSVSYSFKISPVSDYIRDIKLINNIPEDFNITSNKEEIINGIKNVFKNVVYLTDVFSLSIDGSKLTINADLSMIKEKYLK